ncbi:MAG TPA: hypothetical protein VFB77_02000 [Acidimicrobiales bacterium]|nr:hypothetical protein [Acidimicrobiales bacterium]
MTDTSSPTPDPGDGRRPDLRYVAVGALVTTGSRLVGLAGTAAGAARAVAEPVATRAFAVLPASVQAPVLDAVAQLERQGAAAVRSGTEATAGFADAVADRLARDPLLLRFIGDIVDGVLPAVLERLADEPDQVRAIIYGQSRGMVEELADSARGRAAAGDELVDRLVDRLLRRRRSSGQQVRIVVAHADGSAPHP